MRRCSRSLMRSPGQRAMARDETHERDRTEELLHDAFAGEAVPALRPGFEARLARRLEDEELPAAVRRPLPPGDRWLLGAYWVAAAAAAAVVLSGVDIGPVPWPALAAIALTAAGLSLPFLALRRATSL